MCDVLQFLRIYLVLADYDNFKGLALISVRIEMGGLLTTKL
jgi:hypothetical protein